MWNPPLVDEQPGKRGVRAGRGRRPARRAGRARGADDLLPEVAPRRRADPALRDACGSRTRAAPTSPSGSRPTAPATRPRSGARSSGGWPRASCWRCGHQRARARHRHRRARRGDLRDVPGHGREPAPDVGPRRPPRHRPRDVRRRRGRARPVLLPPPRRVPRPRRWRRRSSTTSPRRSTSRTSPPPPTSCRSRPRTTTCSAPRWEQHAQRLVKQGALRERGGRYLPRGPGFPAAGSRCAARRPTRSRSSRRDGGEMIGTVESARAPLGRPPRRGLPAHGRALRGRGARPARAPRARAALRRRLVHAAEEGDRDLHRGGARAARRAAASS